MDDDFFDMGQIGAAVDRWVHGIDGKDALLIYVHGKGRKEPEKTWELLPDLIAFYGVRPLVLHWQPSKGLWPDDGAKAAGPELVTLLRDLMARPRPAKPIVLLGQSLGNFAIQHVGEFVRNGTLGLPHDLLKTVVLSAAAIEAENHHVWLQPLAQTAETYVVVNEHDNVLEAADLLLRQPLGRRLDNVTLANNVTYLDLSGLGKDFHRYYRPDSRVVPPKVKAFYDKVLRGATPVLTAYPLVRGRIRKLS